MAGCSSTRRRRRNGCVRLPTSRRASRRSHAWAAGQPFCGLEAAAGRRALLRQVNLLFFSRRSAAGSTPSEVWDACYGRMRALTLVILVRSRQACPHSTRANSDARRLLWTWCGALRLKSLLSALCSKSLALRAASRRYSKERAVAATRPKRRGAGRSRGTNRRASYHGSSAGVGRLLHAVVRPARRSPLAGGTRGRYAPLSKADPGTLVGSTRRRWAVTPSTRQHTVDRPRQRRPQPRRSPSHHAGP